MACACKVNQQINEIQKRYGVTNKKNEKNFKIDIQLILKQGLIYTICLIFINFKTNKKERY